MREAIELMSIALGWDEVYFQWEYYVTRKARLYTMPRRAHPHLHLVASSRTAQSSWVITATV